MTPGTIEEVIAVLNTHHLSTDLTAARFFLWRLQLVSMWLDTRSRYMIIKVIPYVRDTCSGIEPCLSTLHPLIKTGINSILRTSYNFGNIWAVIFFADKPFLSWKICHDIFSLNFKSRISGSDCSGAINWVDSPRPCSHLHHRIMTAYSK